MKPQSIVTPSLQEQAKALGDPTRHAIFRYLVDAPAPVGVAELTEHFGFNHNAIRQHLAKLMLAALVTEETAPAEGRGRPRLVYAVHPGAAGRWGVAGPYERLSLLLSEMLRTGDAPEVVGRRAGRRLGVSAAPADPVASVVDAMARQGFDPEARVRGRRVEVVLHTCPFATTALADPDMVCSLHLGIAQGVVDSTGGLSVDELVRHDPRRANCRLRLQREPAGS